MEDGERDEVSTLIVEINLEIKKRFDDRPNSSSLQSYFLTTKGKNILPWRVDLVRFIDM